MFDEYALYIFNSLKPIH